MPMRIFRSETGCQPLEASGPGFFSSKPWIFGLSSAPTAEPAANAAAPSAAVLRNERREVGSYMAGGPYDGLKLGWA